jgi:DMSO reductase family type II enzyme molybdopterin subunit
MASGMNRRGFLQAAAAGTASLALGIWKLRPRDASGQAASQAASIPAYTGWADVYRAKWTWDSVARSTHFVNCWPQAHCTWNVYLKDGIVWREEQAGDYPQTRADVPDFNPRGCQKGGCYSKRMYDPSRLEYPLKRVGERGSGRWQRIGWEQALGEIADSLVDTITSEGSDRVIFDLGPLYTLGVLATAHQSLALLLDSVSLDPNTEIGDGARGLAETFGKITFDRSADDFFFSDLILIWGGNPVYTQIPNAHFLTEARYHGARIVCIGPDHSSSAVHADLWVPVKPGCDAALALGIAHVLVSENLFDRDFVSQQTDLPLLVREDTRLYLRGSDLARGGSDEELYLHDPERGVVPAPRGSLDLGALRPSLEGRFEVTLSDGTPATVRPVFSWLRERLADYTPEKASKLCGTRPALIRDLARGLARAEAASSLCTTVFSKYYHGNLVMRTQALIFSLLGQFGKKGSGLAGLSFMVQDGLEKVVLSGLPLARQVSLVADVLVDKARLWLRDYTQEMMVYERYRGLYESGELMSGALFWYVHAGLVQASDELRDWDPHLERPVKAVLEQSLAKGWQHVWPKPGNDPRVMFVMGSNPLRRVRSSPLVLKNLWPKLRTIVTLDSRMSTTALHSDYVLPVTGWYERTELKWVTGLTPFIHAGAQVAEPCHESKSDWEILSLLAKAIQQRARERGVKTFSDRHGNERRLDDLYEHFSRQGEFGPTDEEKVAQALLENSSNLEGVTWDELKQRGWARFTGLGGSPVAIGTATEIRPDDTITHFTKHVFEKEPYPTLSRRIQFYQDHELYLEMGEELPRHKDPPTAGGDYPLLLSGGHTRWSIHASWRDDALMLQQQRGEPVMYMGLPDAEARGIRDGERVRVFNDLGEFQVMAKLSPAMRPGMLVVYHAWEDYQFRSGVGYQSLIPSPLNPVELSGGQYHLRPMAPCLQPSHTDRDTRVEVARIESSSS